MLTSICPKTHVSALINITPPEPKHKQIPLRAFAPIQYFHLNSIKIQVIVKNIITNLSSKFTFIDNMLKPDGLANQKTPNFFLFSI